MALILVLLVHDLWDSWGLRGVTEWSFPALLLLVTGPFLLFLLGFLVFPRPIADWDLEDYYYEYARMLWGLDSYSKCNKPPDRTPQRS